MTARATRAAALPPQLPPIGLDRAQAAAYVGVSISKFDAMVLDGRMPPAKRIDGRRVWSRPALDKAFADLPDDAVPGRLPGPEADEWDAVHV